MFEKIKGRLGFGVMRLKQDAEQNIDFNYFQEMVDYFMQNGFNYFDTAQVYLNGLSEVALRECLVKKYPRESFSITDKLSPSSFRKEEDIIPFFNKQLETVGVDYFDFYLMHAQQQNNYEQYKRCHAYEIAKKLKDEGKIKHIGISFHDTPEFLDKILSEQKDIEVVQLQFNYLDYESNDIRAKECFEVAAKKHRKPIIVMEPVRGGTLANLPLGAKALLSKERSEASYAFRFVMSFEEIFMILSGMNEMSQLIDNVETFRYSKPLTRQELENLKEVAHIIRTYNDIGCTACGYCLKGCPKHIAIPSLFKAYNIFNKGEEKEARGLYLLAIKEHNLASSCIRCGRCENICPQHLKIRDLLDKVKETFEH